MSSTPHVFPAPGFGASCFAIELVAHCSPIVAVNVRGGPTATDNVTCFRRFGRWAILLATRAITEAESRDIVIEVTTSEPDTVELNDSAFALPATPDLRQLLDRDLLDQIEQRSFHFCPSPRTRQQVCYFSAFDHATNMNLLASGDGARRSPMHRSITALLPILTQELADYFALANEPQHPTPVTGEEELGTLQETLIRDGFGITGIEYNQLANAYLAFGSGELRFDIREGIGAVRDSCSNGGPNSSVIFFLAVFAFRAAALGRNPEFWRSLMPTFLACCECYILCYSPEKAAGQLSRRPFTETQSYSDMPWRRLSKAVRRQIYDRWRSHAQADLPAEFHRLLRASFTSVDTTPLMTVLTHDGGGKGQTLPFTFPSLPFDVVTSVLDI